MNLRNLPHFNLNKVPKLASFQEKLVNIRNEKVVLVVFYYRNTSAVILYVNELHKKLVTIGCSHSSIKDRLRTCVEFLMNKKGSALSNYQKLVLKYTNRVLLIYN